MRLLNELIKNIHCTADGSTDKQITGIQYDSRKIKPGNIFFCFKGSRNDGKKFIKDAVSKGAVAVVSEEKIESIEGITILVVDNALQSLADISSEFYDYPSRKIVLIGVTGTNGKTTITYLLESIFKSAGIPSGVVGTINYRIGDEVYNPDTTTPQSSDLQYLLHRAVEKRIKIVVMEVSSHALVLERVRQCEFDTGIFTNLTRDHLDFHKTMEDYLQAKIRLFKMLSVNNTKNSGKFAIINKDAQYSDEIIKSAAVPVITYGLKKNGGVFAQKIKINHKSMGFTVSSPMKGYENMEVITQLAGKHNIYNILAACACAFSQKIDIASIKKGIENLKNVPGRLERIDCGQNFSVLIDYAHTDDALNNVLNTLREMNPRRLITVFGCGGDRDRSKRPLMGDIATALSDYVIITSDNQRSEDPEKIILDIESGARKKGRDNYKIIVEREKAIECAINMAERNDIILLAGKGHETYQVIGNKRLPFNEREIACKYISKKAGK